MQKENYTIVLTHDVDLISLRKYPFFSKMFLKFIKDCIFSNLFRLLKRDIDFFTYLKSFCWGIGAPLVKIGLIRDPWELSIEKILQIEKKYDVRSTFYFIPFKNIPGHINKNLPAPERRGAKYDIKEYRELLIDLEKNGWEIGVHGLNAHISVDDAMREIEVFKEILPYKNKWGIRMHWLYQPSDLWSILKKAGFYYDTTFGSNEKIGFIDNKFFPFKKEDLWILPMNIQDSTLLAKWRNNLTQKEAEGEINKLLDYAQKKHAVVTILWHNTSFAPPFYWDRIYEIILIRACRDGAKIVRAIDILRDYES